MNRVACSADICEKRGGCCGNVWCLSCEVTSGLSIALAEFGKDRPGLREESPVYAVYDKRLEQNCAVVGFTGEFVDHSLGGDNVHSRGGCDEGREGRAQRGTSRDGEFIVRAWCWEEKRGRGGDRGGQRSLYSNFEIPRFCCDSKP